MMRLAALKTAARRMSTASSFHPHLPAGPATLVGRCWVENVGPCVITLDEETGICYDISQRVPTMTDLLNTDSPVDVARGYRSSGGVSAIGNVKDLMDSNQMLAPCDLSPVKACGGESHQTTRCCCCCCHSTLDPTALSHHHLYHSLTAHPVMIKYAHTGLVRVNVNRLSPPCWSTPSLL